MRLATELNESANKCIHPYIRKGYYLGIPSDVYACVICGEQRPANRWDEFERRRTPPSGLLNKK